MGVALVCAASGSSALTLGRASGAAILGRPLELTVPVQIAADEDVGGLCFEADVFYGDFRQDSNRITVTFETLPQGPSVKVRVQASTPVDEPIVTVYLRAACGKQATRRYVLLADLVSELVPSPTVRPLVTPLINGVAAEAMPPKGSSRVLGALLERGRGPAMDGKPAETALYKPVKRVVRPSDDGVVLKPSVAAMAPTSQRARLKLAPLDFTQERDPTLKISNELISVPVENMQKRGEAAALWRALNATPQDVLRDGVRLQAMESNLKALQDQTAKNRHEMLDLVGRLDRAESQRYANPLVYGLLALLFACGAGLAYGVFRLRSANAGSAPWWRGHGVDDKTGSLSAGTAQEAVFHQAESKMLTPAPSFPPSSPAAGLYEVDIDLQLADSAFSDLGKPMPVPPANASVLATPQDATGSKNQREFLTSVHGALREISTEEMLDVRQQADFFMTLGQYDEAIGALEAFINASAESNPLVYLDLLKVFHTLSKKSEFDRYRNQFNELFAGNVPVYAAFNQPGRNLDAYPDVCGRIVKLWPSVGAVEYIEQCLIRVPGTEQIKGFDLEAFRDLLMLHGVIKRLASSSDSGLMPFSTVRSMAAPDEPFSSNATWPTVKLASSAVVPPNILADIPVDLDLSEPVNNLIEFDGGAFLVPDTATPPVK